MMGPMSFKERHQSELAFSLHRAKTRRGAGRPHPQPNQGHLDLAASGTETSSLWFLKPPGLWCSVTAARAETLPEGRCPPSSVPVTRPPKQQNAQRKNGKPRGLAELLCSDWFPGISQMECGIPSDVWNGRVLEASGAGSGCLHCKPHPPRAGILDVGVPAVTLVV